MTEKHICKICSMEINQLVRHLTIKHDTKLIDYLACFSCGEEYNEIESQLKQQRKNNSPWSKEYYIHRGFNEDDAAIEIDKLRSRRRKQTTNPCNPDHWIKEGLSVDDAAERANSYRKSIGKYPTKENLIVLYGIENGNKKWEEFKNNLDNRKNVYLSRLDKNIKNAIIKRWFILSKNRHDAIIRNINYDDYKSYNLAVKTATKLMIIVYKDILDADGNKLDNNYGKNGYDLDHKYSKYGGFINKVHPLQLCSLKNIELIPRSKNQSKGNYCSISLEELSTYPTILNDEEIDLELRGKINEIFVQKS